MKFFHSDMPNSPVLNGVAGALTDLLDAVLVTGFGTKTASSLVVSGGVATLTVSPSHSAVVGATISVAGATPSGLNGEKVVTAISAGTVSYATGLSDQTATGTVTFKIAPLGWTIAQTTTNTRAYKPSAAEASGCLLRVLDTGTTNARVWGYESMTDIDTGSGRFPTDAQQSGGLYWPKSDAANSTARRWFIFGDDRMVYVGTAPGSSYQTHMTTHAFGDVLAQRSGDAYSCLLTGDLYDRVGSGAMSGGDIGFSQRPGSSEGGKFYPRAFTGLGGSVAAELFGISHNGGGGTVQSGCPNYSWGTFPNNADNGLLLCPVTTFVGNGFRGNLPGVWHVIQDARGSFATGDIVAGTGPLANRKLMAVTAAPPQGGQDGTFFVDITGPWRS